VRGGNGNGKPVPISITRDKSWQDGMPFSTQLAGNADAPVTLMELTDLQCPACKGFEKTLNEVAAERPNDLRIVTVNFPLEQHEFAKPAAYAAECADASGRYREWVDVVFAQQDSLGKKSWGSLAADAGIADTTAIGACAAKTKSEKVDGGLAFGEAIEATGTPTVIINGWRYSRPPSKAELLAAIDNLKDGRKPPRRIQTSK
jgi:protein-disulfide isomerase